MGAILDIALAVGLCLVAHEGGHWLAARLFGHRLRFRFAFGRFWVPRLVWRMPCALPCWKMTVIAMAGFVTEHATAGALLGLGWPWMAVVAVFHIVAYPLYAGEANDFRWIF